MRDRDRFDICVIGAGVIGLAIAYEMAKKFKQQDVSIVILEQEASFGQHTSSRNSEVIHAGIYYPTGSLKSQLCVTGKELLYRYCEEFEIPHQRVGKLIVAKQSEIDALEALNSKAIANGVHDLKFLEKAQLRNLEPHIDADAALLSPSTGIIDSHSYMQSLLHQAEILGALFAPYSRVEKIDREGGSFLVHCLLEEKKHSEKYQFNCEYVINSAGLGAQTIARNCDSIVEGTVPMLHYCKGDYFDYRGKNPFTHLIYPMPEANTAGLGVHATMDLSGQLKFGPDTEFIKELDFDINVTKAEDFADSISAYFANIKPNDLKPAYSGIRPKLSQFGAPPADFVIQCEDEHEVPGLIQLFGIESPGLTASLAIARHVADRVLL